MSGSVRAKSVTSQAFRSGVVLTETSCARSKPVTTSHQIEICSVNRTNNAFNIFEWSQVDYSTDYSRACQWAHPTGAGNTPAQISKQEANSISLTVSTWLTAMLKAALIHHSLCHYTACHFIKDAQSQNHKRQMKLIWFKHIPRLMSLSQATDWDTVESAAWTFQSILCNHSWILGNSPLDMHNHMALSSICLGTGH